MEGILAVMQNPTKLDDDKLAETVIEELAMYGYSIRQHDKGRQEQLVSLISEMRARAGYIDINKLHGMLQPITQNRESIEWLLVAIEFYIKERLKKGGCSVYESSLGFGRWRIEHCVVSPIDNIVADAVFAYNVSNWNSAEVSSAADLSVTGDVLFLRLKLQNTQIQSVGANRSCFSSGEEFDAVARIQKLKNSTFGRPDDELRGLEEQQYLERMVSDAINQFNECSVPLIREKAWALHPRNPANTV